MSTGEDRTAPEITLSGAPPAEGPVDEVAVDLGEDTAGRGLLDPWTAPGSHTGDEATASGRTGEVSDGGGAPTDVRLLGELLGFAGSDPEARARALDAATAPGDTPPSAALRAWLAARPIPPIAVLLSAPETTTAIGGPPPSPPPSAASAPAPGRPAAAPGPVASPPAAGGGFWRGVVLGAVLGVLGAALAWGLGG